LIVELPLT